MALKVIMQIFGVLAYTLLFNSYVLSSSQREQKARNVSFLRIPVVGIAVGNNRSKQIYNARSNFECLNFCTNDISCHSFDFSRSERLCQLYNLINLRDGNLTQMEGTTYYMMYDDRCGERRGYFYYRAGDSCYKFHFDQQLWANAHTTCQIDGGGLISFDSIDKYKHIVEMIRMYPPLENTNGFFVGALNDLPNREWRWLSNDTLPLSSQMWGVGKPGATGGNLLQYARISNKLQQGLDDSPVHSMYPFICEIVN